MIKKIQSKIFKNKKLELSAFFYAIVMIFILPNIFKIFNNKIIFLNVFSL